MHALEPHSFSILLWSFQSSWTNVILASGNWLRDQLPECMSDIQLTKFTVPGRPLLTTAKSLNESSPSSAFFSHSTNFLICSRKILFPLATWVSVYHLRIASSLRTSAGKTQKKTSKSQPTAQMHSQVLEKQLSPNRLIGHQSRQNFGYNLSIHLA